MKLRLAGLAVLAALAVVAVLATTGFGDDGGATGFKAKDAVTLKAHRVDQPSVGSASTAAKRGRGVRLIYKETNPRPVADGFAVHTVGKCPRRSAVLNGFYGRVGADASGVVDQGGLPTGSLKRWQLALNNNTGGSVDVIFGIVCLKP
jgi:Cu/Zn superoxide dismutase